MLSTFERSHPALSIDSVLSYITMTWKPIHLFIKYIIGFKQEFSLNPYYSSYLESTDYLLFRALSSSFSRKIFDELDHVKTVVQDSLDSKPQECHYHVTYLIIMCCIDIYSKYFFIVTKMGITFIDKFHFLFWRSY